MKEKNRVMQFIVIGTLVLSLLVHAINRFVHHSLMEHEVMHSAFSHGFLDQMFFWTPIALVITGAVLSRLHAEHAWIPLVHTLSLTLCSMSIIAGGKGMVEYHFSIFMVLAILMYYNNIALLLSSTVLFAAQHLLGFFFFPELVYGSKVYEFTMVAIHLVFVILFIGAVMYQIIANRHATQRFEKEQNQKLQQTVKSIIESLAHTSQEVQRNSSGLSAQSNELNRLTMEVVHTMHQVEQAANDQENGVEVSRKAIGGMLTDICHIAENSASASELSDHAAHEAEKGNESIQLAVQQMQSMHQAIHTTAEKVKVLGERSQEINQIVNLITDVASRTNLLALNAAIEAARAGEHGKGFTIVSTEVRKLAEQTSESAKQIAELIEDIQMNNQASIHSMDQVIGTFAHGNEAVVSAGHAFERIRGSIHSVASQMRDISGTSQQMSANTQQFSASMEAISLLSSQLTDNVKSVSKRTDEQDTLINKASDLADKLEEHSHTLNEIMMKTKHTFSLQ
ncbi:hypothetical protein GQF01_16375 [Paenibacillus sp. 5J-6]|uniref:Methyl-accepting transducer domain-containing protein n=1 Tax=Paenibacillus silvestris TaxID=2606219 RepID=A0A6L8V360_9BACL|nr:methyl-accepting chemotaxis protein [Paenibacillus silvestris]MZQ83690.1 hypothetical protein [Paenibacillus silvestris]